MTVAAAAVTRYAQYPSIGCCHHGEVEANHMSNKSDSGDNENVDNNSINAKHLKKHAIRN